MKIFNFFLCLCFIQHALATNHTWDPKTSLTYALGFLAQGSGPQSVSHQVKVVNECPQGQNTYTYATVRAAATDFPTDDTDKYISVTFPTDIYLDGTKCSGLGTNKPGEQRICIANKNINSQMPSYWTPSTNLDFSVAISSYVGSDVTQYYLNATITLECSGVRKEYYRTTATVKVNLASAATFLGMSMLCCCCIICGALIIKVLFWYFVIKLCCDRCNNNQQQPVTIVQQPLVAQPQQQMMVQNTPNGPVYVPIPHTQPIQPAPIQMTNVPVQHVVVQDDLHLVVESSKELEGYLVQYLRSRGIPVPSTTNLGTLIHDSDLHQVDKTLADDLKYVKSIRNQMCHAGNGNRLGNPMLFQQKVAQCKSRLAFLIQQPVVVPNRPVT